MTQKFVCLGASSQVMDACQQSDSALWVDHLADPSGLILLWLYWYWSRWACRCCWREWVIDNPWWWCYSLSWSQRALRRLRDGRVHARAW